MNKSITWRFTIKKLFTLMLALTILMSCFSTTIPLSASEQDSEPELITAPRDELFPAPPYRRDYRPGYVLVGFKEAYTGSFSNEQFPGLDVVEVIDYKLSAYESWSAEPNADQFNQDALNWLRDSAGLDYGIKLAQETKENVWEAIQILANNPIVAYAMPCFIIEHAAIPPDDTYYDSLWGMHKIQAEEAWYITTGNDPEDPMAAPPVQVGILDTGIDNSHPDLKDNIDKLKAYNVMAGNSDDIMDYDGRGTHVAGIVGAVGNNDMRCSRCKLECFVGADKTSHCK